MTDFVLLSFPGVVPAIPWPAGRYRLLCLVMVLGRKLAHPARLAGTDIPRNGGPRLHNARPRLFRAASAGLWVSGHVVPPAWGSGRYSLDVRPTSRACFVGQLAAANWLFSYLKLF